MKPLIGILTADGGNLFRGNHANFIDLIRTGRKRKHRIIVVTPRSFSADFRSVDGFQLSEKTGIPTWRRIHCAIPSVIYNRLPNRSIENQSAVKYLLTKLNQLPDVQLFNPHFFNKWDLFQFLKQAPSLAHLLPETVPYTNPKSLQTMLQKYPILFAKPVNGKAGVGMIRIQRNRNNFLCIHQTKQQKRRYHATHQATIERIVQRLIGNQSYILQQAIPLSKYKGRPYDLRILAQKQLDGNWGISGIGIRIAGKNAISTHVPMGGKLGNRKQIINHCFGNRSSIIENRIKETALSIANAIEQASGETLGEMSLDLGIEQNGRLWFFEANAKPMKFDEPEIRKRSLNRIIDYAEYLREDALRKDVAYGNIEM
ncbi:YheC/D like ATP-grasp [Seinonella peptonophila]|uniref:YheC/D like ATP-grasp n=1 Tax=Seinonella peptonophila TaxID=112248 RepID=A0A1M4W546_9BACL|nr:YheC/YheD family protein [Seinonella peptonophila]SHE76270.1 YheC/D like ATP-grasp [Seinonella peptonophila]